MSQDVRRRLERTARWLPLDEVTLRCVDGRDPEGVVGTPGGGAGELLLALASLERLRDASCDDADVERAIDLYLDRIGPLYLHTDRSALGRLGRAMAVEDAEALVRDPPAELAGRLLDRLVEPAHVGCGHLRAVLERPAEYGTRRALAEALLRGVYRRLQSGRADIEFVVLDGPHAEHAVLQVRGGRRRVPALAPSCCDAQVFVAHPDVVDVLRDCLADAIAAHAGVDPVTLRGEMRALGERQLSATLALLAPNAPTFVARAFAATRRLELEVTPPAPPAPARALG